MSGPRSLAGHFKTHSGKRRTPGTTICNRHCKIGSVSSQPGIAGLSVACRNAGSMSQYLQADSQSHAGFAGNSTGLSRALKFAESFVKTDLLRYYMHDGPAAFRFELAGDLTAEGVCRLQQDWRTASSALGDRRLIVDMTFVSSVDVAARALINRWHREGALLIANSRASRALAESILGEPLYEPPASTTRRPRRIGPGARFALHSCGVPQLCFFWLRSCFPPKPAPCWFCQSAGECRGKCTAFQPHVRTMLHLQ